jgi:hypothetical protein
VTADSPSADAARLEAHRDAPQRAVVGQPDTGMPDSNDYYASMDLQLSGQVDIVTGSSRGLVYGGVRTGG